MVSVPLVSAPIFEHYPDGFGIAHVRPRLSWRFSSPDNVEYPANWVQAMYEVEIKEEGSDSKHYRVDSAQSVLVPWPGPTLIKGQAVTVRVRCYAVGSNPPTQWSPWSHAECTILEAKQWSAVPISSSCKYDSVKDSATLRPVRFRRTFAFPPGRRVARARLYTTCYGVYEVHINGCRVGDHVLAPGWTSYRYRLGFQTFNVTAMLREGANCISAEVAEGWYAGRMGIRGGRRFNYGSEVSLLAQLEVTLDDGAQIVIATDKNWRAHPSAIISSGIYDGEIYDARLEEIGWMDPAFVHATWDAVEERAFPSATLFAPGFAPMRVTQQVAPVAIFTTKMGKTIVDFGQNLVGVACLRRLPEGREITLRHAEVLEGGELGVRPLRGAKCTDVIITPKKEEQKTLLLWDSWSPKFTFHGFRYVQIEGWEETPLGVDNITASVIHTDMQRRGWFKCSEPMINQLHENIVWGMRGNFLSLPTDCPQRDERLGWTGDIQVFGPTANFLYDTVGILSNWLEDVSAEQLTHPQNIPGLVVPDVMGDFWTPTPQAVWHDAVVLTPWALFQCSGDAKILHRQYAGMIGWLRNAIRRGEDGLWESNIWQLGDWVDPAAPPGEPGNGRTDGVLVADAYLVHVTFVMSAVCTELGLVNESQKFAAEAAKLKQTFQRKYVTPVGNLANYTQAAISLAVEFGLYETPAQLATAGRSLERLVRAAGFHVSTGFAGTPIILPALTTTNQSALAYRMLREKHCPSWLYPVTMGATTIWERWDALTPDGKLNPGQMLSFNHYAFGAVGAWLHSTVAGISSIDGWKTVRVQPVPGGGLTFAEAIFDGPYGSVRCHWKMEVEDHIHLDLLIPPNSRAEICLPGRPVLMVGSGRHNLSLAYSGETWPPPGRPSSYSGIRGPVCDCP